MDREHETDILVLGGGFAGLWAAIKAKANSPLKVTLVDKATPGRSGNAALISGVLTYFDPEKDDLDKWLQEGVEVGLYLNNQPFLERAIIETYHRVRELDEWGVPFMKENGEYHRRHGSGHLHAQNVHMLEGGWHLMWILRSKALSLGVELVEKVMVTDLLTSDGQRPTKGKVVGAVGFHMHTGAFQVIKAKTTVLANGPCTMAWKHGISQSPLLSGEGQVAAFDVGVQMANLEMLRATLNPKGFQCAPGANAIFGHGAYLVNRKGERFLSKWAPERIEHAPKSVIMRAITVEEREGRGPVYLDLRHVDPKDIGVIEKAVPVVTMNLKRGGYDLKRDLIEFTANVFGTEGTSGGLMINERCETNIQGLFAAGDITCHPTSGADNMIGDGMNSIIEGAIAGESAREYCQRAATIETAREQVEDSRERIYAPLQPHKKGLKYFELYEVLQPLLFDHLGIIRTEAKLREAIKQLDEIEMTKVPTLVAADFHELARVIGVSNVVKIMGLSARAAIRRTESRGFHYRADFPKLDNKAWLKRVMTQNDGREIKLWEKAIPIEGYKFKPQDWEAI